MPRGSGRSAQRCFARAALAALGALAACRGAGEPLQIASARVAIPVRESPATRLPAFSHIFVIVRENKQASEVVGHPEAPYLNE